MLRSATEDLLLLRFKLRISEDALSLELAELLELLELGAHIRFLRGRRCSLDDRNDRNWRRYLLIHRLLILWRRCLLVLLGRRRLLGLLLFLIRPPTSLSTRHAIGDDCGSPGNGRRAGYTANETWHSSDSLQFA